MHPAIEIISVWEDETLFEVSIRANNRKFCGEARCYTTRGEIKSLCNRIGGFPKSAADEVHFSTQYGNSSSYFNLSFVCTDSSAHVVARVKIAEIVAYSNTRPVNDLAEFEIAVEPAAIDTFSRELENLSSANIGVVTAKLNGKTSVVSGNLAE